MHQCDRIALIALEWRQILQLRVVQYLAVVSVPVHRPEVGSHGVRFKYHHLSSKSEQSALYVEWEEVLAHPD